MVVGESASDEELPPADTEDKEEFLMKEKVFFILFFYSELLFV